MNASVYFFIALNDRNGKSKKHSLTRLEELDGKNRQKCLASTGRVKKCTKIENELQFTHSVRGEGCLWSVTNNATNCGNESIQIIAVKTGLFLSGAGYSDVISQGAKHPFQNRTTSRHYCFPRHVLIDRPYEQTCLKNTSGCLLFAWKGTI